MKKLNVYVFIAVCSMALQWFASFQPAAFGEDGLGETIDCTDVSVNYVDDPSLTQDERLRLMDKAFQESLDKFELCRSARELAKSSGAAAGTGAGAGNGAGAEGDSKGFDGAEGDSKGSEGTKGESGGSLPEAGDMSMGESVASSTMSGTEAVKASPPEKGLEAAEQNGLQGPRNQTEPGGNTAENMGLSNGKPPEDIPSAQNDDTLAAQIRYAAQIETDPEKKRQLWNEYRKYKGLPTK